MAGSKVNDYSIGDSNIESVMLTLDKAFYGKQEIVFTNMTTTTVPALPAGSICEVGGALFKFDSQETISTTDPVTSSSIADGSIYVVLVPSGSSITAAFTATAPTWSDSKQGYYGTGVLANAKYIGGCTKAATSYSSKFVYRGFEKVPKRFESKLSLLTAQTINGGANTEFTFTVTHTLEIEAVISILPTARGISYTGNWISQQSMDLPMNVSSMSVTGNVITLKVTVKNTSGNTWTVDLSLFTSVVGF